MPELRLNREKDTMLVTGVPGEKKSREIPYPSDKATALIEEASEEIHEDVGSIIKDLEDGETIEF